MTSVNAMRNLLWFVLASSAFAQTWSTYGGSPENTHYSTLTQVNRANVTQLKVAWTFDSGDAFKGSEMECNPIVVNGTLYATTPKLRLIALDAATGKLKWDFDPNNGKHVVSKMRNRGVTYADGHVFFVSRQYLYSVNAATGQLDKSFGEQGRIDLRKDLGRDPEQLFVSATSPAVAYKDLLIVGTILPETLPAAPGDIRAYDMHSGKLRWTFHTIPHPGEPGYDSWPKDAWKYIGGVNAWSGLSLDEKRGIVYAPLGSATFDFYGSNRLGDDLYANSLLALDAQTGKRIWHFQTVHHDLWDRDLPTPPALVTVMHNGEQVDAAAQITKSGFVYLFNRVNGEPLFPVESRHYPTDTVDGDVAAQSQPLPTKPAPFARQAVTADMITDRTPAAHDAALAKFQGVRSAGQFVPPSKEGTIIFPGFDGGGEWGGSAFDPETGYLYINSNEMAWILRIVPKPKLSSAATAKQLYNSTCAQCHHEDMAGSPPEFPSLKHIADQFTEDDVRSMIAHGSGRMPAFTSLGSEAINAITRYVVYGEDTAAKADAEPSPIDQKYMIDGYNKFLDIDGYPAIKPPWGNLSAINLNTGEYVWKHPFGEYPELNLPNSGSENYGGGVVTAGGLFFIAATNYDKKMHAFDKTTGKLLWEIDLPAAGNATPAVYEVNGQEYIVIGCGGGKSKDPSGGSYVAFALPQETAKSGISGTTSNEP
jgi:quinoprotein glucose dehydrogenase